MAAAPPPTLRPLSLTLKDPLSLTLRVRVSLAHEVAPVSTTVSVQEPSTTQPWRTRCTAQGR